MTEWSILKNRRDFQHIARHGDKWVTPSFIVQAMAGKGDKPEFGFTVSKKVGNAVVRNRAKRRLREVVRLGLANEAKPGWRYVLIARYRDHEVAFTRLVKDARWALSKLHKRAAR